ncbi:MAG: PEP-CTERM sorting domain-containing protein [Bryobacteraceae bacterium]
MRIPCVAVLLCASVLCAKPVISIGGQSIGATGIDGISLGWSMNFSATVSVSAPLENGNGAIPAIGNTAYLTQGALPNLQNVVANTTFELPGNFAGEFILFPSVTLGAGSYWLMFDSAGPPSSYANIWAANPVQITAAPGAQFLGYYLDNIGVPVNNAFSWQFSVTEIADTPEPSTFSLYLAGLAAVAVAVGRRKNRKT